MVKDGGEKGKRGGGGNRGPKRKLHSFAEKPLGDRIVSIRKKGGLVGGLSGGRADSFKKNCGAENKQVFRRARGTEIGKNRTLGP